MSKLTLYVLIVCQSFAMAMANESSAQRKYLKDINIELGIPSDQAEIPLKELIKEVEASSNFTFAYTREGIRDKAILLNSKYWNMLSLLKEISVQGRLSITRVNETITLIPADDGKLPEVKEESRMQQTISGRVTDENEEPLPGATIIEKGTNNGTVTDVDGKFSLEVAEKAILIISFVGYQEQEISINNQSVIDVSMVPDLENLEEIVVIGYGTTTKKDVTGAIASVDFEDANIAPNTSILQAVQGRVPGINIGAVSNAGEAPSINIRGQNSLSASNDPLIVVDGIIYPGSINDFSPTDIKTIDFLKDASAAAVYGSRSANGVVLITTKSGESNNGKPKFTINAYQGIQEAGHLLDLMNGEQYIQKILDYREAAGLEADPANIESYLQPLEVENYQNGHEIDWYDELFRTASIENYELGISGTTSKTQYYFSGTYMDQEGIAKGDDFQRITLRARFSNDITDWLSMGINTAYTHLDYSGNPVATGNSVLISPYATIYKKDNPDELEVFPQTDQLMANPFLSSLREDQDIRQNLFGVFNIDIDLPVDGLTFKFDYSRQQFIRRRANFDVVTTSGINDNGRASKNHDIESSWLMNNRLNYSKIFGNVHKIDATVVYTRDYIKSEGSSLNASNFVTPILRYNAIELGTVQSVNSYANDQSSEGFMTRLNYGFNNKYLLTGTFRRDGFSGFATNNKYANFYSASMGWVLSEESFFNVRWIDFLKFRLSYGENGNQGLGSYSSLATVATDQYVFGDGGSTSAGFYTNSIANPNLKWETTRSANLGVNFELFDGRLSGDIDLYRSKTNDLLVERSLAGYTGFTSVWTNLGEIQNKGIEVYLNSVNLEVGDFSWGSSVSFSLNRNKIVSLYGEDADGDGVEDDDISQGWFIGESLGAVYGYQPDGIYQLDDADIPDGFNPGDFKILDTDGEEGITPEDRIVYANNNPNYRGGLSNTFTYKNLSLFVFVNSIQGGNNWYMGDNNTLNPNAFFPDRINMVDIDYWTPDNPSNTTPRINYKPKFAHRFDQDRSFVRLQDVTLAYDLSDLSPIKQWGLDNLRVYVSGKNLATWTKWKGYDPELGTILNGRPIMRSFVFGLEIGF